MGYLLLIVEPLGQRATRTAEEGQAANASMVAFGESLAAEGRLVAMESLSGLDGAVRLGRVDGRMQRRDGPFAESKEMIGGFFLLQNTSREEAIAIAGRCPAAQWATVELRETAPCHVESRAA